MRNYIRLLGQHHSSYLDYWLLAVCTLIKILLLLASRCSYAKNWRPEPFDEKKAVTRTVLPHAEQAMKNVREMRNSELMSLLM